MKIQCKEANTKVTDTDNSGLRKGSEGERENERERGSGLIELGLHNTENEVW